MPCVHKKLFALGLCLGLLCCFASSFQVKAADAPEPPWGLESIPPDKLPKPGEIGFRAEDPETWLEGIIDRAVDYFFLIGMIIAPLIILVGAFMFFTSGGDPARTQSAKRLILWAAIALAILLLAKAITSIIKYILQVD